jgi:ATP-dependent Lon protease
LLPSVAVALADVIDQLRDVNSAIAHHSQRLLLLAARDINHIPNELRERVDLVVLPVLSASERSAIIRDRLVPQLLAMHGLEHVDLVVPDSLIEQLQAQATYAEIERLLAQACRKAAVHAIARQQGLESNTGPIVME